LPGALAQAVHRQVGSGLEQESSQVTDRFAPVQAQHPDVGFLGDLAGFLARTEFCCNEVQQRIVVLAEQTLDVVLTAGTVGPRRAVFALHGRRLGERH